MEVALNRVEWKTAGGKAVVQETLFNQAKETPVSVLVVTDGKELDPFWRQILLPGACLAYIKQDFTWSSSPLGKQWLGTLSQT